jgi:hypothetical protein
MKNTGRLSCKDYFAILFVQASGLSPSKGGGGTGDRWQIKIRIILFMYRILVSYCYFVLIASPSRLTGTDTEN